MKTRNLLAKAYLWLVLVVLYAPIAFIVVFSFTEAKSLGNWTGFSTQLYRNLFDGSMQNARMAAKIKRILLIMRRCSFYISDVALLFGINTTAVFLHIQTGLTCSLLTGSKTGPKV